MRTLTSRSWKFARAGAIAGGLVLAAAAHGASTGSTNLYMPQSDGAGTANGDYISATPVSGGLYHYFIEVPSGLTHFVVDVFDADYGAGAGANEDTAQRDRDRTAGTFGTVTYSLVRPDGTTAATQTCASGASSTFCADNAWSTLFDSTGDNYRDNFGTAAYNNNDGSLTWATNWIETNDDNNAGAGQIRITGGELRIGDNGGTASTIEREADLTGFTTATLNFDFRTTGVDAGDQLAVQVSANGGGAWSTLETFTGPQAASSRSYNITSSIAANTRVRFIEISGYGNNDFFFVDNLEIKDSVVRNGHWDFRVDETGGNTNGINAFGLRAHDGTSGAGGTELPVYYDSHNQFGQNPPASGGGTKTYSVYPYITSGCSASENDFDYDSNSGTVGSIALTSRTGSFTHSIASTSLSANDAWARNTFSGWTTDSDSTEDGIWLAEIAISNYFTPGVNGNYANVWFGNSAAAANPPSANPTANAFRVYLPTDAGAAPVKAYVEQLARFTGCGLSGPNPPVVGQTSCYTVTVRVVNPEAQAITFSASNLVTATVPGAGTVYGGGAAVSQGAITAQPSVGGTGNVTWNPGTVSAGATALLSYRVKVTPTSAGQRLPLTGTPASNGTTAKFVDNTGNTTQTRATYTFGPLCELAVTVSQLTPAVVADVRARAASGGVLLEWNTVSEVGTVAFDVLRWDARAKRYVKVNARPLPAFLAQPQGGHYRYLDASAPRALSTSYEILEYEAAGTTRLHGPFVMSVGRANAAAEEATGADGFASVAKPRRSVAAPRAATTARRPVAPQATLGSTQVMVGVHDRGLYRIGAQDIASTIGLPLANVRKDIANHTFRLTLLGSEVGWIPGSGYDSIVFYGQPSASPFADENVYLLRRRNGTPLPAVADLSAPPGATAPVRAAVHSEQQKLAATVVTTDPRSDFWYWDFVQAGAGPKSFPITLPAAVSAGGSAHVHVALRGATSTGVANEHHAVVSLNGIQIGEVRWSGLDAATGDFDVSESILQAGDNALAVEGLLDSGAPYSFFYLDAVDTTYDRSSLAEGDSLVFGGDGVTPVTVSGFSSPDITVLDVTDPSAPAPVRGTIDLRRAGGSTVSLQPALGASYVAFTDAAVRAPDWLGGLAETRLLDASHAADEVILAPDELIAAVQPLAEQRRAQGLEVEVVSLQDVWNGFHFGMPDPQAIKDFLSATRTSWRVAPRYVLLAGGGTFDYRNYLGYGGNLVPPMLVSTADGLFASDAALADFDDDGIPDMEVGRLPAGSERELSVLVSKILAYESAADGPWVGEALLLADADAQTDFTADARAMGDLLPAAFDHQRFELATEPVGTARPRLVSALDGGAGILNYVGHGGLDRLSASGLLFSSDAASLTNGGRAPIVTAFTCVVNRFEVPGFRPIGAELVLAPQGGAVSVLAPSGESVGSLGRTFGKAFFGAFAGGEPRLGDVLRRAKASLAGGADVAGTLPLYNLLGDPALLVRRPSPASSPSTGGE